MYSLSCVKEKDVLLTLNKLGINTCNKSSESFSWLLEYPETSEIFNWLCTYVNENNIHASHELLENFDNPDEPDTDFERKMLEVEIVYPGIFEINASQVDSLKRKLENEEKDVKNCEKLLSQYLSLEHKIDNEIGKLTQDELNTKLRRQAAINECIAKGKALDELHGELYNYAQKYKNIFSNFSNPNSERYFLSQQTLHEYKQYCSSFNASLELWMKKKIPSLNSNVSVEYATYELLRLKNAISDEISQSIREGCVNVELTARLDSRSLELQVLTAEQHRIQEIEASTRIQLLTEDHALLVDQLSKIVELYTDRLLNETLLKNALIKRNKYEEMYRALNQCYTSVLHALGQYNLLCLLLQIDKCKMESLRNFLKETFSYVSNYHRQYLLRYKHSNKARKEISMSPNQENIFVKDLIPLITNVYDKRLSVNNAIEHLKNRRVRIETLENKLFSSNSKEFLCNVDKITSETECLKKFLYCGPTLQPLIVPYKFLQLKAEVDSWERKVDQKTKYTFDLHKQTKMKLEKNKWLKYRCNLWAWFLTDPENVVTTISQLQDYVVKQSAENMLPIK